MIIYTTIAPRTSKIFITSLKKDSKGGEEDDEENSKDFITLNDLTEASREQKARLAAKMEQAKQVQN